MIVHDSLSALALLASPVSAFPRSGSAPDFQQNDVVLYYNVLHRAPRRPTVCLHDGYNYASISPVTDQPEQPIPILSIEQNNAALDKLDDTTMSMEALWRLYGFQQNDVVL